MILVSCPPIYEYFYPSLCSWGRDDVMISIKMEGAFKYDFLWFSPKPQKGFRIHSGKTGCFR